MIAAGWRERGWQEPALQAPGSLPRGRAQVCEDIDLGPGSIPWLQGWQRALKGPSVCWLKSWLAGGGGDLTEDTGDVVGISGGPGHSWERGATLSRVPGVQGLGGEVVGQRGRPL